MVGDKTWRRRDAKTLAARSQRLQTSTASTAPVNATQLLEQDEVDWTTRPTVDVKKDFSQELGHHNSRSKEEIEEMRQRSGIEILDGDSEEHPVPGLIDNFDEACWPQEVQQALVAEGFEEPTPIQKQIWPIATKGRDVVGIAETGSGKTVSYVLPMITHIRNQAQPLEAGDGPVGLVLAPTRELARQILRVCERYGGLHDMKSTTIVGGTKIDAQKQMLQEQNHIIVATPGRFLQALGDEWTTLNRCTFVVLDEADELLKKEGFEYDIRAIMTQVRKERQVLMFSATWPEDVQNLAGEICTAKDDGPPVHVRIGGNRLAACKNVVQRAEIVDGDDAKYESLKEKLQEMNIFRKAATPEDEWPDKCIIFCRSRAGVQSLKDKLWQEDFCYNENNDLLVSELHGDMLQKDRDWAMEQFRDGSLPCVIATGVLARGHDIPKVRYVINYDMPKMAEDYIHRVGRTGRAGNTGYAFTFVNRSNWKDLQWGHEYLLGVLEATKQDVDATLKDVIDNHANQAEWQNDQYDNDQSWEDAANWNVGSSAKEAYVASLDDDLNAVKPEHQARKILGEYAEQGSFYGCKVYQRTECQDDGSTLHLYYYGEEGISKGWYIGPALGGDIVYAWAGESHDPPEGGWHFFSLEAQEFEPLNAFKIVKKTEVQGWFDETHEGSWEAGQGQSSTDAWQEAPGMPTSTEAYSVEVVWTKEPTNGLNVNAEEFKMEAEWHYDSAQGVYQGELPPEMVAEAYAQQEDAGNAAWPQGYEAMDPAAAYYPSDAYPTDVSSQAFDYNAQAFYQAQEHYYGPGAEEASWAANTTTMEATGNGSRPPPGLEEERNLTGAVVVDAEPFVLADDEVAVQADQAQPAEPEFQASPAKEECSPAEFFDPDAEERTCTGLVDPEEEEQAGADAGDEPAAEDLHHRVLAQMLQAPEVEPLAEEAAEPTAEEAPAVESTAKNAESAEPDTAVDQPMAHQEWNGFWENKDEPASEAQAVPESCPVYSIDKDPKVEVDPGVAAEVEEAPENAAAVSSEIEGKMEAAPENAAAAAAVDSELDGKMVEAPENAAAEIECKMAAEAPENAAAAAVSSVIDGKMEEAPENAAADVSSELDGKMVETPENAAAVSSEIDGKMAEA
ncbi:DBP2 [Symbiodinium natans]|uniref:RNA helicase n=1 Tax=Symbiodinium natans TaxID=878477 RepID=A0A812N762_9DINO|nr:DBP2 [Symbiodinium natans]